jgi:hypothetical protein
LNNSRYRPYPSFSRSSFGINLRDAELRQYLVPVGFGPSGNRITVPGGAAVNIEHERGKRGEEIEFQIKWPAVK